MAVVIPTGFEAMKSGVRAPASGQTVRQEHARTLVENLNHLRATIAGPIFTWCGDYSTTSTTYQTVAKGVCYQPYTTYSDGVESSFHQIVHADNADVRISLAALGGASANDATTSFTTEAIKSTDRVTNTALVPTDRMEITIEVKVPTSGTARLYAVTLESRDQDATYLR